MLSEEELIKGSEHSEDGIIGEDIEYIVSDTESSHLS